MSLKKWLPTRREFIRDVSIGVAVAGAAGFGAAKLFPSEASIATKAEIGAVTDNGAIILGPLGSRNLGTSHRLLSGESVTFEAPSSKEIHSSTSYIMGVTSDGLYGFQATQKGFGLYGHAPDFPLILNGTVSLQGGTLAHYTISNWTIGSKHLTLWQGDYHDLYTYIPDSLSDAISLLARFDISDSDHGMSVAPKVSSGHSIQETRLTVEFGDYFADVYKASDFSTPSWPGQPGVGGDFYSDKGKVLFIGGSAAASFSSSTGDSITDTDLQKMVNELRVTVG